MPSSREPKEERPFLELTETQFQALTDVKATELLRVQSLNITLQARHAALGVTCGTLTYLASLAAFVYLALHGQPRLAMAALGTPLLTIIKRILVNRI